ALTPPRNQAGADRLLPRRALPRHRLHPGPDQRGPDAPARGGGAERLRGVPEALPARDARRDGVESRPHRAAHRARAPAAGSPRDPAARDGLAPLDADPSALPATA